MEREQPAGRQAATAIAEAADFEDVFREHFAAAFRFIARRVGTALAEDLAAEVFATAYRRRASYQPSRGSLRSWLYGIAANVVRGHWRAEQQLLEIDARLPPPDPGLAGGGPFADAADERVIAASPGPRIAGALAALKRDQRDVLLLHAWAGLSHEEIAAALGIAHGTADGADLLRRGRQCLVTGRGRCQATSARRACPRSPVPTRRTACCSGTSSGRARRAGRCRSPPAARSPRRTPTSTAWSGSPPTAACAGRSGGCPRASPARRLTPWPARRQACATRPGRPPSRSGSATPTTAARRSSPSPATRASPGSGPLRGPGESAGRHAGLLVRGHRAAPVPGGRRVRRPRQLRAGISVHPGVHEPRLAR